jgi:Tol biopolymer transport system component
MDINGGQLTVVAKSPELPSPPPFAIYTSAISQDGMTAYFTSNWYSTSTQIISVRLDGTQYKKINIDRSVIGNDINITNPRVSWDGKKIAFTGYINTIVPVLAIKPADAHIDQSGADFVNPEQRGQIGISKNGRQLYSKDPTKSKGLLLKTGDTCPTTGYNNATTVNFASSDNGTQTIFPIGKTYCINVDDVNFVEVTVTDHHFEKNFSTTKVFGWLTFTWKWVQNPGFIPLGDDNIEGDPIYLTGAIDINGNYLGAGYDFLQKNGLTRKYDIFVANIDGSNIIQLTNDDDPDNYPCFSPDSSDSLYFVHGIMNLGYPDAEKPDDPNIYKMDIVTPGFPKTQITTDGENKNCAISPSGNLLAYSHFNGSDYDIMLFDLRNNTAITTPLVATSGLGLHGNDTAPSFSPDGAHIAFVSDLMDPSPDIYVVDIASGAYRNITRNYNLIDTSPAWTP